MARNQGLEVGYFAMNYCNCMPCSSNKLMFKQIAYGLPITINLMFARLLVSERLCLLVNFPITSSPEVLPLVADNPH